MLSLSHIASLCCLHHMIELGGGGRNASAAMWCVGSLMLSLCVVESSFLALTGDLDC